MNYGYPTALLKSYKRRYRAYGQGPYEEVGTRATCARVVCDTMAGTRLRASGAGGVQVAFWV